MGHSSIAVFDLLDFAMVALEQTPAGVPLSVVFGFNDKLMSVVTEDGMLFIYEMTTGKVVKQVGLGWSRSNESAEGSETQSEFMIKLDPIQLRQSSIARLARFSGEPMWISTPFGETSSPISNWRIRHYIRDGVVGVSNSTGLRLLDSDAGVALTDFAATSQFCGGASEISFVDLDGSPAIQCGEIVWKRDRALSLTEVSSKLRRIAEFVPLSSEGIDRFPKEFVGLNEFDAGPIAVRRPSFDTAISIAERDESSVAEREAIRVVLKKNKDKENYNSWMGTGGGGDDVDGGAPKLVWPVKGKVISGFGLKPSGLKSEGINIAVPEGTEIRAAASGIVAYAGNELEDYGNLILVQHDGSYYTAYGHALELFVKRGDTVNRGDVIAKSGQTGSVSSPQLLFELRKGALPMDPMRFFEVNN